MKKLGEILILSLCACIFTIIAACASDSPEPSGPEIDLQVPETIDVAVGSETKLDVTITGTDEKATFTSSDTSVATVTEDGTVKGIKVGNCNIAVKVADIEKKCAVNVKLHSSAPVLTFNNETVNLHIGDEFLIVPELKHLDKVVETPFTFESSDATKVTVDENGKIKALALGQAEIGVSYSYIGYNETQTVTVNVVEDIEMTISDELVNLVVKNYSAESEVPVEKEVSLTTLKVGGVEVENPVITWASEDEDVATVENGLIKAVASGETIVSAVYNSNAGTESRCEVLVTVSKENVNSDTLAFADTTWDYGYETISDKMYMNVPANLGIAQEDILSVRFADSEIEIGTPGSFWIAKSEGKGEKDIIIETNDFNYNLTLDIQISAKRIHVVDFNKNSIIPGNPVIEELDEYEGEKQVIKTHSLSQDAELGDIWYNHNGGLFLNTIGLIENRGYLVMDVMVNMDSVKPGGYLYGYIKNEKGKLVRTDEVDFRYNTKVENAFDTDLITITDIETNKPTTLQANKWVRVVVDMSGFCAGYKDEDVAEINFYPSFARPLRHPEEVWEAYFANMTYMTPSAYRAKYFKEKTFTVSFETFSSTDVAPIEVEKFATLKDLPVPETEGNVFSHWELNGCKADGMTVGGNITLKAVYENPAEYEVVMYERGLDGKCTEKSRNTLTGKVGSIVTYEPELPENGVLIEGASVLTGTLKIGEKLELAVYYEDSSMYPDGISGDGIVSLGKGSLVMPETPAGMVFENGLYDSTAVEAKGAYERRLQIADADKNITKNDCVVFLAVFMEGTTRREIFAYNANISGGGPCKYFDFYDINHKFVAEGDRKDGEWYYIVSKDVDNNDLIEYYIADWHDAKILFYDVYAVDANTRNTLFPLPTEDAEYKVTTYTEQADGTYLASEPEVKTGKIDSTVTITPEVPEGFILDAEQSVLSGVVAEDGSLELKVYFKKTIVFGRTTDAVSTFTKAEGMAADFTFEEASYHENANLLHITRKGNNDPWNYIFNYTITADDLGKYMVVKILVPQGARRQIKLNFWQKHNKSLTEQFDLYSESGKMITDIEYDTWYNCVYYLAPETIKADIIDMSICNWVPDTNAYLDTVTFMEKADFEANFDYIPRLLKDGVKSKKPFEELLLEVKGSDHEIKNVGSYVEYTCQEGTGMDSRKFSIRKSDTFFAAGDYAGFLIRYNKAPEDKVNFMMQRDSNWIEFDFYDTDFNFVKKEDRKVGEWYYVIAPLTGHNVVAAGQNGWYSLADWNPTPVDLCIADVYAISEEARNTLFPKPQA